MAKNETTLNANNNEREHQINFLFIKLLSYCDLHFLSEYLII